MDWLTAILLAVGISIFTALTDKFVMSHAKSRAYTFLVGTIGLLSLFFLPFAPVHMNALGWLCGILIGAIFSLGVYTNFKAYEVEEVSRLVPLGILSTILITIGAAIFFNQHLSSQQYWAFALFALGSLLLSTRIKTSIEFLDFSHMKITNRKVKKTSFRHALEELAADPSVPWIRFKKKLKLIRGLGWYLASVLLYVPYTLLGKEFNSTVGLANGFAAIRVGLFVGSALLIIGHWHETKPFLTTKLGILASIKELFGMSVNFLVMVAMLTGPAGIVQSMWSIEAVGVFIFGMALAKLGIIKESLVRRDLIQKAAGVAIVAVATTLLFL